MANTSIPINTNPTSDPQYTGGEVVLPSDDSVIDINPINENAEALAKAVNQLFWDVNQGGGGTNAQVEINRQNIGAPAGQTLPDGNLQSQVNTVKGRVTTLETFVGDSSYNSGLAKKVKDNEDAIADNTSDIATNTGDISALNTAVSNLGGAVSTNTQNIATNTNNIATLSAGVANNTAVLETLGGGTLPTQSIQTIVNDAISGYVPVVADGSITANKLANDAVTSAKIQDDAITSAKILSGAVTDGKLANNSINTANIKDGAVTTDKVASGAITSDKIANGTIDIADLSLGLQQILGAITSQFDYITDRGTFTSSAKIDNNPTAVVVTYTTYYSGFSEIYVSYDTPSYFITGTTTSTITVELPNEITYSTLSESQIASYNVAVTGSSSDKENHSCRLTVSNNVVELSVGGLSSSESYGVYGTRLALVGNGFTVAPPSS